MACCTRKKTHRMPNGRIMKGAKHKKKKSKSLMNQVRMRRATHY